MGWKFNPFTGVFDYYESGGAAAGSNKQLQYNDSGSFGASSNLIYDSVKAALGVQVSSPSFPVHAASVVGSTIDDVVSGLVSLVAEVAAGVPSGTATGIKEMDAPATGNVSFIDQGSGAYYATGNIYTYRIYPVLNAGGVYFKSSNYFEVGATDPNDNDYYNISISWDAVTVSGETIGYILEKDVNGGGFSDFTFTASNSYVDSASGSMVSYSGWPSFYSVGGGAAPDAPSSFDYATQQYDGSMSYYYASGQTILYELDQYKNISGTNYVSGTPVSISFTDDSSGNYYYVDLGWTFGGTNYDGVLLRKSFDGGTSWYYQLLPYGSYPGSYSDLNFSDDGNGFIWGNTYSGGGSSTYNFDVYGVGTSPSGNSYFSSLFNNYGVTLSTPGDYIIKHSFSGVPAGGFKILAPGGGPSYGVHASGSTYYDVGYTSWGSGPSVSPSSYGFSGTAQNRDYRVYAYSPGLGIYSQIPLQLSTLNSGGSKSVSGSFTYPSGATQVKILRQVNGGGYTVGKIVSSPTTTFVDDSLDSGWSAGTVITPNAITPGTARFDRASSSVSDSPILAIVSTGSGVRYPKISLGVANDSASAASYQNHIYGESTTGYLNLVGGRLNLLSSLGGTPLCMLGNANIINNTSSSTVHFQIKGQSNAYVMSTRSDRDTAYFGQESSSDGQSAVQIHPYTSVDTALVLKGHSSHSTSSVILRVEDNAGSFKAYMTMGGQFQSGGSVSAPGLSFYGDSDTGFFSSSSNAIGVSLGGAQKITLSSTAITLVDGVNIGIGTSTGTMIGINSSSKIGFWSTTPIVRPTTSVAAATRVAGGGTTITDTDTFDGYTIAKVVKALRNIGLLA